MSSVHSHESGVKIIKRQDGQWYLPMDRASLHNGITHTKIERSRPFGRAHVMTKESAFNLTLWIC